MFLKQFFRHLFTDVQFKCPLIKYNDTSSHAAVYPREMTVYVPGSTNAQRAEQFPLAGGWGSTWGAADKGLLLGSEKEPTAKTHSMTEPQETLCKGEETRDTEDYLL